MGFELRSNGDPIGVLLGFQWDSEAESSGFPVGPAWESSGGPERPMGG